MDQAEALKVGRQLCVELCAMRGEIACCTIDRSDGRPFKPCLECQAALEIAIEHGDRRAASAASPPAIDSVRPILDYLSKHVRVAMQVAEWDELKRLLAAYRPEAASPAAGWRPVPIEDAGSLVSREARSLEILEWLEEQIGTDWTCTNCGHATYHVGNFECAECATPFPLEHELAFKLHATGTDNEECLSRVRQAWGLNVLPLVPAPSEEARAG